MGWNNETVYFILNPTGVLVRNGIKVRTTNGRFQVEVAHGDLLDSSIENNPLRLLKGKFTNTVI